MEERSFTSAMSLTQTDPSHVPQRYILPPSQRPNPSLHPSTTLPIIDFASLHHPSLRFQAIEDIRMACKEIGFFQVINHGISPSIMEGALDSATEFFNLPNEEKLRLISDDVNEPVRYGTSINHVKDKVHFWRDFLKHYSHPLSNWIHLWPSKPPTYQEKMGNYAKAAQALQKQLMEVVFEGLGLDPNYLREEIEEGSQVIAVNCYPACPEPELALGMPPHSDYGSLTILLQDCAGLQVMDKEHRWVSVPASEGTLLVHLGDQMEIMSNGRYKSVIHRATVNSATRRLSIASLHSLAMDKKVGPAPEMVDEQHPMSYREGSFRDFLNFLSNNDILKGRFIETLKMRP